MYVAAETFKRKELHGVIRAVMVFMCVMVFILSGFEHSIAGMYYFSAAGMWGCDAFAAVGIMTLGNAIGGMLLPVADKFRS
jgi:formate/nitrite transporter FocA (FNT family)